MVWVDRLLGNQALGWHTVLHNIPAEGVVAGSFVPVAEGLMVGSFVPVAEGVVAGKPVPVVGVEVGNFDLEGTGVPEGVGGCKPVPVAELVEVDNFAPVSARLGAGILVPVAAGALLDRLVSVYSELQTELVGLGVRFAFVEMTAEPFGHEVQVVAAVSVALFVAVVVVVVVANLMLGH